MQLSRKRNRQSLGQMIQGGADDAAVEAACEALCVIIKQSRSRKSATDNEYLVRADQAVVDRLLADNGEYLNDKAKVRGGIGVQVEPDFASQFDISLVQGSVS